jgi:MFS family permease
MTPEERALKKGFWGFFWTQVLGALNDNLYKMAMIVWITFEANDLGEFTRNTLVIVSSGVYILPFFLFSATAGWLADRYPKDLVIRWTKVAEIFIMLAGAFAFMLESIPALMIVLFFMGAQSAFFSPAKYGIVPELCESEKLMRANGLIGMGNLFALLAGTLGGIFLGLFDKLIYAAIAVLLVAIVGYLTSTRIPKLPARAPELKREGDLFQETFYRLRDIKRMPLIFPFLISISMFWFHGAYMLQLLPLWSRVGGVRYGVFISLTLVLFSCGSGLGSLLCGQNKKADPASSMRALILLAVGTCAIAILPQGELPCFAALTIAGMAAGYYSVPLYTIVQKESNLDIRARVFSGGNILDAGFMVLASILMQAQEFAEFSFPERFITLACLDALFLVFLVHQIKLWRRRRAETQESA